MALGPRRAVSANGDEAGHVAPNAPRSGGLDCLVGDIVVTHQEIASKVKGCTDSGQEGNVTVYPKMGPDTMGHKRRISRARFQKKTYPRWRPTDDADIDLDKLGSMWKEMRRGNPGTISSSAMVERVKASRRCRNDVAHARRTCGNAAIRNDWRKETYDTARLEWCLGRIRGTLAYVDQLYAHRKRAPMK